MKAIILSCALAAGTCIAAAQTKEAPMHTETTFELTVRAGYNEAFALFGPEGERAWAGEHWDPKVVWPAPARDAAGMVFTIAHGAHTAVWVNTQFDREAGRLQYVYVIPEIMATTIDVSLRAEGRATHATVTYHRTGLSEQGRSHVAQMTEADKKAGAEWQAALDAHLGAKH